ncbi:MAG: 16S rRNA (uracil(1498)-N(3))-methyltransferase [Ferruginibacter sp.]
MALPFFYKEEIKREDSTIVLNEETSRHIAQVLRMQNGEQVQLTDGAGNLFTAEITDNNKKRCAANIISTSFHQPSSRKITIAISLLKNAHRFEWFLEKATEIGVSEIVPLICERTEKQHFRQDRMKGILVSAMLQSQQTWLPLLHEPVKFTSFINQARNGQKFIAHCEEDARQQLIKEIDPAASQVLLIGPEGDFTKVEIEDALQHQFVAVSLGDTRLRTETAGVVAATLLKFS